MSVNINSLIDDTCSECSITGSTNSEIQCSNNCNFVGNIQCKIVNSENCDMIGCINCEMISCGEVTVIGCINCIFDGCYRGDVKDVKNKTFCCENDFDGSDGDNKEEKEKETGSSQIINNKKGGIIGSITNVGNTHFSISNGGDEDITSHVNGKDIIIPSKTKYECSNGIVSFIKL